MGAVESVNPATGERLAEIPSASSDDVLRAVKKARQAFEFWRQAKPEQRANLIIRAKNILLADRDSVADLLERENGKARIEAMVNEIGICLDLMKYYGKRAPKMLAAERVSLHSPLLALTKRAYIHYEPMGIVGVITPWNYPLSLSLGPVVCALAAGNTVILKPSEFTPLIANKIFEMFQMAGLPEGVLQVIHGGGEAGAALVNSAIDKIHFTGSVSTGIKVAETAAKKLLPFDLELGGSDPMIVLDDADLERASNAALWGRFTNAGQSCNAIKRIFVSRKVADPFLGLLKGKVETLSKTPGAVRPMINERQRSLLQSQFEDSLKNGARLLAGGRGHNGEGFFWPPTLIAVDNTDIRAMREETFGPLLSVMVFDHDGEAADLANKSEFGLGAAVFSRNVKRAQALAARLRAGSVTINDVMTNFAVLELPFGGIKKSGMGFSHGGAAGLRAFTAKKSILIDRWGAKSEMYWYPYSEKKYKFFSRLFGWLYR